MRKIEIIEDVCLRFPGRGPEFDLGVEVGSVAVLLAQGVPLIEREISTEAVEQLRTIAEHFGYLIVAADSGAQMMSVRFSPKSCSPTLRLIHGGRP